jgi:hypothetical protein
MCLVYVWPTFFNNIENTCETIIHFCEIALMMEAVCTPKMSIYSEETILHYIPEGSHLHGPFLFPLFKLPINFTFQYLP